MSRVLDLIFVYGTLQQQGAAHHLLVGQATFMGAAWLQGRLYEVDDYPGAVLSDSSRDRIQGELYRMHRPDILLAQLDHYEEVGPQFPQPHEYRRMQVSVSDARQKPHAAWTYIYTRSTVNLTRITSGRWFA
jgi:gamma-glutamylcyclotransferase (GGCT)/AIG2-like uncharacterized protein YtfP